jgi:hypothetical protein
MLFDIHLQGWRWRQHVSPKHWHRPTELHGAQTPNNNNTLTAANNVTSHTACCSHEITRLRFIIVFTELAAEPYPRVEPSPQTSHFFKIHFNVILLHRPWVFPLKCFQLKYCATYPTHLIPLYLTSSCDSLHSVFPPQTFSLRYGLDDRGV